MNKFKKLISQTPNKKDAIKIAQGFKKRQEDRNKIYTQQELSQKVDSTWYDKIYKQ